jgi:hypothetical protein
MGGIIPAPGDRLDARVVFFGKIADIQTTKRQGLQRDAGIKKAGRTRLFLQAEAWTA